MAREGVASDSLASLESPRKSSKSSGDGAPTTPTRSRSRTPSKAGADSQHDPSQLPADRRTLSQGSSSPTSAASRRDDFGTVSHTLSAKSSQPIGAGQTLSLRSSQLLRNSTLHTRPSLALAQRREAVETAKPRRTLTQILKACSVCILDLKSFQAAMFFITIYALVGDDIRLAYTSEPWDEYFDIFTLVALAMFTIEILLASVARDDYFLGFFFGLDVIATLSLILDLTWVRVAILNLTTSDGSEEASVARAGRASRVGTRAGRIVRVIRLIRLIRIVKLYKQALETGARREEKKGKGSKPGEETGLELRHDESRVGKKLSRNTTQRVIILVLAMLFVTPQLNIDEHDVITYSKSASYGADVIYQAWREYRCSEASTNSSFRCASASTGASAARTLELRRHFEEQVLMYVYYHNWHWLSCRATGECIGDRLELLSWVGYWTTNSAHEALREGYVRELQANASTWDSFFLEEKYQAKVLGKLPREVKARLTQPWGLDKQVCAFGPIKAAYGTSLIDDVSCPSELRPQEFNYYQPNLVNNDDNTAAPFVFVFDVRNRTQKEAILNMIQTMFICLVLAFGAMSFSKDANDMVLFPIERMIAKVEKIRKDPLYAIKLGDEQYREQRWAQHVKGKQSKQVKKTQTMETKILENAIIKLGSLLALGFGEAGSEIIGQNMDDDNASVNAMIPGSKVDAVYGFCDIRNFTDITEVLKDKVMVFVNQVAEIVHSIADDFHGAPNKNVGDAFLLVWRVETLAGSNQELRSKVSDLSVMSLIKMVAALNRSALLCEYREHPGILARIPNYRVRLGFGLHLGWAIEGAIGSEFKIDASYLSPHVNMASRLEAATKTYGVTILMTEPLVRSCGAGVARQSRPIDHVMLRGVKTPIRLFTVDLDGEILATDAVDFSRRHGQNKYEARMRREKRKAQKLKASYDVSALFEEDDDVKTMRDRYCLAFFQEFEKGFLNYQAGEWDVARSTFERTLSMIQGNAEAPDDGPSSALLKFMKGHGYGAPASWPGYRMLDA